jgi:hypothetical protein
MAKKGNQGPGRPFIVPQPNIEGKDHLDIPDDVVYGWVREVLDPKEYQEFKGLPRKTVEAYINAVKNSWFGVTAKSSSSYLNYGEDEFQDLAGVQVGLSLNPADWKNPKEYVKKTATTWLKGVVQKSDIERELEKELLRKVIRGEGPGPTVIDKLAGGSGGFSYLTDAQLVEPRNAPNQQSSISGGQGVDNIEDYRTLASSLMAFVDDSQSVADRGKALAKMRSNYYKTLEKEAYYLLKEGSWLEGSLLPTIEALAEDDRLALSFGSLESGVRSNKHLNELLFESVQSQSFVNDLNKPVLETSSGSFSLSDFTKFSVISPPKKGVPLEQGPVGEAEIDFNNSYTTRVLLNKLHSTKNTASLNQLQQFVETNYKELGFSSAQAVRTAFKSHLKGPNLAAAAGTAMADAFRPFTGRKLNQSDLVAFSSLLNTLDYRVSKMEDSLNEVQESLTKFHPEEYIEALARSIPDAHLREKFVKRSNAALKAKMYTEIRNLQLATGDLFDAVERGNFFRVYMFLGSYNDQMPKILQKIKTSIDDLPLFGNYKVKHVVTAGGEVKNYLVYNLLGLAQADRVNNAYTRDKTPLLALLSSNEVYLFHDALSTRAVEYDFYSYKNQGMKKIKLEVFNGSTYDNFKAKYNRFEQELTYLKPPQLKILVNQLSGSEDAFEGIFRMVDALYSSAKPDDVNSISDLLAQIYNRWVADGKSTSFFDTESFYSQSLFARAGVSATPHDMARYKKSFNKLFKVFEEWEKEGVDTKDFFGVLVSLRQDKFIDAGGYDKDLARYVFRLKTNMPLLNKIASRLSNFQTYLIKLTENKLLKNTIFKLPVVGDFFSGVWNIWKPGVGSIDTAFNWYSKYFKPGQGKWSPLLSRIAGTRWFGALKALGQKLAPAWIASTTAVTLGLAYLAHVAQRLVSRYAGAAWNFLKTGNIKVFWYATKGFIDDIFLAPIRFLVKLSFKAVLTFLITFTSLFTFFTLFFQIIISGDSLAQYRREDLGGIITLDDIHRDVDGEDVCYTFAEGNGINSLLGTYFSPTGVFNNIVTSPPGFRTLRNTLGFHHGIDYAGNIGDNLANPFSSAIVESAVESSTGYGNHVILKVDVQNTPHYILFGHLDYIGREVHVGKPLPVGSSLGTIGSTGNSTGPHLHFEIRVGENSRPYAENPCAILDCSANADVIFEGEVCSF